MSNEYKLIMPVKIAKGDKESTVTEVKLEVMKGKHQLGAYRALRERGINQPSDGELGMFVLAEMSGLSLSVLQEFCADDLEALIGRMETSPGNFQKKKSEPLIGDLARHPTIQ